MTNKTCSKPGGQHVNKSKMDKQLLTFLYNLYDVFSDILAKTGVEIRFHVKSADWISEGLKEKLFEKVSRSLVNFFQTI